MTMFVKCINNNSKKNVLSIDKTYKVIECNGPMILVNNDQGNDVYYKLNRFHVICGK